MNSPEKTISPEMISCPKCGDAIAKHNLKRHLARVHSPKKDFQSITSYNVKVVNEALRIFLATEVKCPKCKQNVKLNGIKSHFTKAHQSPVPPEMLDLLRLSEPANRFKSEREKEAYWRAKSGFVSERSDDVFDRGRVVSGGAYGLGKSRKH